MPVRNAVGSCTTISVGACIVGSVTPYWTSLTRPDETASPMGSCLGLADAAKRVSPARLKELPEAWLAATPVAKAPACLLHLKLLEVLYVRLCASRIG